MAVTVRIPTTLRPMSGGKSEVQVEGATLAEVLASLDAAHPGFRDRLFDDEGGLRRFVNVFVADDDVRYLQGLDTRCPTARPWRSSPPSPAADSSSPRLPLRFDRLRYCASLGNASAPLPCVSEPELADRRQPATKLGRSAHSRVLLPVSTRGLEC